jgi:hypothetical protein
MKDFIYMCLLLGTIPAYYGIGLDAAVAWFMIAAAVVVVDALTGD